MKPSDQENITLVDWIMAPGDTHLKEASAVASKATRTHIKEDSFQRAIIPYEDITNGDLDYNGEGEICGKWFEIEADTRGAKIVPYNSSPITVSYRAEKYLVVISQMITPEYVKNVNELRGYRTDVRGTIQDSMMRDLHTCEDTFLINTVDRTVGSEVDLSNNGWTIETQNVDLEAGFTRSSVSRIKSFMTDRGLPNYVNLLNERTANEYLTWHHDEVGGPLAQEILTKGLKAHEQFEFFNQKWIATIKNKLVPNGVVYTFTHPDFLGHACRLEDIKVTMKKDYDILHMRADQQVGMTFGVSRGLQKSRFSLMRK
jgi:hypothetical protein